jgi:RNA polymerase sigma-70 factor, ECF subfamily
MSMNPQPKDRRAIEARFAEVFAHLGLVRAYAARRGARDPDALAAEAMTVAWRRLADVPQDDPRPWLIATARNLVLADRRSGGTTSEHTDETEIAAVDEPSLGFDLDPELDAALASLSAQDREALLLVAWEDLTPSAAAASLGITAPAFRVRLHRARRRLIRTLDAHGHRTALESQQPRLEHP